MSSELGGLRVCHPYPHFPPPSPEKKVTGEARGAPFALACAEFLWVYLFVLTWYDASSAHALGPQGKELTREKDNRCAGDERDRFLEYAAPGLRHTGGFGPGGGAGHACGRVSLRHLADARRAFARLAWRGPGRGPERGERPTERGFDARDP